MSFFRGWQLAKTSGRSFRGAFRDDIHDETRLVQPGGSRHKN